MKFISSRENAVVKHLRMLADDARYRRETKATLIDGDHLLAAALDASWPMKRLILRDDVVDSAVTVALLARAQAAGLNAVEAIRMPSGLFNSLSPVVTPTGILAEIALPGVVPEAQPDDDVLLLAGIQDAGNLGTLLRTAFAAGIRHIWLDGKTTQAWSPKAMRAGMGAQFCLSLVEGCDLKARLASNPRQTVVTSLGEGAVDLYELDLYPATAWIFGSEGQGVPAELQALAGHRVRIPMPGAAESLNVSAAAAICLFEQVRQRRCSKRPR